MSFKERYTTQEKKGKNPDAEKDKTIVSNDAYLNAEMLEKLYNKLCEAKN